MCYSFDDIYVNDIVDVEFVECSFSGSSKNKRDDIFFCRYVICLNVTSSDNVFHYVLYDKFLVFLSVSTVEQLLQ